MSGPYAHLTGRELNDGAGACDAIYPQWGNCLCGSAAEGVTGPVRKAPPDLIHRGGGDWQCPVCKGWFRPLLNVGGQ
jgi:hypothetical protein